jgi:restriction system protein
MAEFARSVTEWEPARTEQLARSAQLVTLQSEYKIGNPSAVEFFFGEVLNNSVYPEGFPQESALSFTQASGVLVVDFELPNQSALPALKEVKFIATRREFQEVPVSDAWLKRTYDEVIYQTALRTLHELFIADDSCVLKSIVFNGWVHSIDKATGAEIHACILSVQAGRQEFLQINLRQVDPKACFRKLKGVASNKLAELTPDPPHFDNQ